MTDETTRRAETYVRIKVQVTAHGPTAVRKQLKRVHDQVVKTLMDEETDGFVTAQYDAKGNLVRQFTQGCFSADFPAKKIKIEVEE